MRRLLQTYLYSHAARLLVGGLFIHALLLPFLFVGLLHLETSGREAQFVDDIHARASLLAGLFGEDGERGHVARLIDELVESGKADYAEYQAPNGEILASGFNPDGSRFEEDSFVGEHGDHIYYLTVPANEPGGSTLRLGFSERSIEQRLGGTRRVILLLVGGYLVLTALMIVFYGRLLQRSVRRLRDVSRRLAGGQEEKAPADAGRSSPLGDLSGLTTDLERMREILLRREQDIAQREARQQAFLESAAEGIVIVDAEGRIETFNKASEKIFGCPAVEALGTSFVRFLAPGEQERFLTPAGHPAVCSCVELNGRRHTGEACDLMLSVSEATLGGVRCFTIFVQDISERIAYEARLAHLATHDSLTGLPNRALFADRLKQVLAHAERGNHIVAILFLDLDRFKEINDTLGHHIGDKVLQAAARRLKGCLRSEDTLARLGGDEFILLLPQLERPNSAAVVAENIVQALARPFAAADRELAISCSIGIAVYPLDGKAADDLSRRADSAMYAAKRAGGNGFRFCSPAIDAEAAERAKPDAGLSQAIERGELVPYYRPRFDMGSRRIVAFEALPYWQHPEHGLLGPEEFSPEADKSGCIAGLADWLLAASCAQGKRWHDAGQGVAMAVRLPACLIRPGDFLPKVRQILAASGLPPALFRLELSAGALAACDDEAAAELQNLRREGVRLTLDGFDSGHLSFASLKRRPLDAIKVERAFVHDLGHGNQDGSLAGAVIAVGRSLHLEIIADGVEDAGQLAYLQAQGCNACQGDYFSPPLTADEASALLRRESAPAEAWRDVA